MQLRKVLIENPDFHIRDNIFYQRGLQGPGEFERSYLSLRKKENRLYTDDIVRMLPEIELTHPLQKEWAMRRFTLKQLMQYLTKESKDRQPAVLEVGCGNGWLSSHLASIANSEVVGLDLNDIELKQAERVFRHRTNLCFAYADIFTSSLPEKYFDYIILSASIQYFRDIDILLDRLRVLLTSRGEIHVLDSPFYRRNCVASARARSRTYFKDHSAAMEHYYHHHTWESLDKFEYTLLHNPDSLSMKILRIFRGSPPFPWLRFTGR